jgi:hypothetical protein
MMAEQAQRAWLHDIRHNPRRFWTEYKGQRQEGEAGELGRLSTHWQQLYAPAQAGGLRDSADSVPALMQQLGDATGPERREAAAGLNAVILPEHVEAAVRKLQYGRMAGPDRLRGELFKGLYQEVEVYDAETDRYYVKHVYDCDTGSVIADLTCLFNAAFSGGTVPVGWCSAYVSAVFKRGDPSMLDNYRGIAVGSVVGKLFSLVLHSRMSAWSEAAGLRAEGQAGFRDGKRTCDHVFVLKHLIDQARASPGSRLYVCFVDFKKAYDLVRRDLLMQCLSDFGVHGNMLASLASMYWQAPVAVKSGLSVGDFFDTTQGVKQGDPLSPLLFGLFIDRVEAWLRDRVPNCGVQLGDQLRRVLLYADDLALMATTPEQLQALLDALHAFCAQYHMHVSVAKSTVVVFGRRVPRAGREIPVQGWRYGDQPLSVSAEFKYLGITFHQTKGVLASADALSHAGRRAMWGMLSRCGEMELQSLSMKVDLFDSLVSPILTYCSEVWGPSLLRTCPTPASCLDNPLQRVQFMFLRRVAGGVRKATVRTLLLREFGCRPLVRAWVQAGVNMWNRVCKLPQGDVLAAAMSDNITLAAAYNQSWFSGFSAFMSTIDAVPEGGLLEGGRPRELNAGDTLSRFDTWMNRDWQDLPADPRAADSQHVYLSTYTSWFAAGDADEFLQRGRWETVPGYVRHTAGIDPEWVRSLAAFRLGAHDLEVAAGRWRGVARHERVCDLCRDALGDEMHMVFDCDRYQALRQQFPDLFDPFGGWADVSSERLQSDCMLTFMHHSNQRRVAQFIHSCWRLRCRDPPDALVFGDCVDPPPEPDDEWFDARDTLQSSEFTDVLEAFEVESEFEVFYDPEPQ